MADQIGVSSGTWKKRGENQKIQGEAAKIKLHLRVNMKNENSRSFVKIYCKGGS